jgi:hypothetical protein
VIQIKRLILQRFILIDKLLLIAAILFIASFLAVLKADTINIITPIKARDAIQ